MYRLINLGSNFSVVLLIISILSSLPTQAVIKQQNRSLAETNNNSYLVSSLGDLVKILGRRRTPGGGKGEICAILPQALVNSSNGQQGTEEIWTDKPVFFWRGLGVTQIDIFERGKDEVFATLKVKEGLTKIKYNGKSLQPGQSYTWQITAEKVRGLPIKDSGSNFQVMDSEKRVGITNDLTKLETALKKQGASVEKIGLEKADYFAKKEMWTDVLEQLYSVQSPSPQLMDTIKKIEGYNFCNSEQAAVSTLL